MVVMLFMFVFVLDRLFELLEIDLIVVLLWSVRNDRRIVVSMLLLFLFYFYFKLLLF